MGFHGVDLVASARLFAVREPSPSRGILIDSAVTADRAPSDPRPVADTLDVLLGGTRSEPTARRVVTLDLPPGVLAEVFKVPISNQPLGFEHVERLAQMLLTGDLVLGHDGSLGGGVGDGGYVACMSPEGWTALATGLAALAAIASAVAAWRANLATDRAARSAERSVEIALAADRRERMPVLDFARIGSVSDQVTYRIRNLGPQDLTSIVVRKPYTDDRIKHEVALGSGGSWADEVRLGPVGMGDAVLFKVAIGARSQTDPPRDLHIPIVCSTDRDVWTLVTSQNPEAET